MKFTAQQIAEMIGGQVDGNPQAEVNNLSKIEEGQPGTLSFLANPQYTKYLYDTKASIVIVNQDFVPEHPVAATLLRVKDAYGAFAQLLEAYNQLQHQKVGIDEQARVSPEAELAKGVYVGTGAVVAAGCKIGAGTKIYANVSLGENVRVGENCLIFPNVCVYPQCVIGSGVTIHAGTVIGSDGFGFAPKGSEGYQKVAQIGNVVIEDAVEIGSNVSIDRATLGSTVIRKGVKLDNLIQIAHNVEIGENTVIASQSGVAGSTKIGRNCMIGGQVGIIGHLQIGDNVKIAAQSGIGSNLKDNSVVQGSPAFAIGDYKKSYVYFRKFPQLVARLDKLYRKLNS